MNIAILGYGTVGKGVEQVAIENGINVEYILMRDIDTLTKTNMCKDLQDILNATDIDCVVECIGGDEPSFSYVKKCLQSKINVISSNKKMIVKHYRELIQLAKENNARFMFSSACGGAIPWLGELDRIANSDELYEISGIMNGTSNYILNKMYYERLDFKQALSQAQELGYAELDPSDDIDGIDTANKLILSMAIAFKKLVRLEDIFILGIRNFNTQDLDYIKSNNYKCVLLAKGDDSSLSVMPRLVTKNSIFYNIKDNNNCFTLHAKNMGCFSLIGEGAGSLTTASNVIRDLKMLNNPYTIQFNQNLIPDYSKEKHIFYIRTSSNIDKEYIDKDLGNGAYISKKISIKDLKTIITDKDFVGEIIND